MLFLELQKQTWIWHIQYLSFNGKQLWHSTKHIWEAFKQNYVKESVIYFDQCLGAAHSKCWLKWCPYEKSNLAILIKFWFKAKVIGIIFLKQPSLVEVVWKFKLLIERSSGRTWSVVNASTCQRWNMLFNFFMQKSWKRKKINAKKLMQNLAKQQGFWNCTRIITLSLAKYLNVVKMSPADWTTLKKKYLLVRGKLTCPLGPPF